MQAFQKVSLQCLVIQLRIWEFVFQTLAQRLDNMDKASLFIFSAYLKPSMTLVLNFHLPSETEGSKFTITLETFTAV